METSLKTQIQKNINQQKKLPRSANTGTTIQPGKRFKLMNLLFTDKEKRKSMDQKKNI